MDGPNWAAVLLLLLFSFLSSLLSFFLAFIIVPWCAARQIYMQGGPRRPKGPNVDVPPTGGENLAGKDATRMREDEIGSWHEVGGLGLQAKDRQWPHNRKALSPPDRT